MSVCDFNLSAVSLTCFVNEMYIFFFRYWYQINFAFEHYSNFFYNKMRVIAG